MMILIEILVLLAIGGTCYLIWRTKPEQSMRLVGLNILAGIAGFSLYWVVSRLLALTPLNLFLVWGLSATLAVLAYVGLLIWLTRKIDLSKMPEIRYARSWKVGLNSFVVVGAMLMAIIVVNIAAADAENAVALRDRSLFGHLFLVNPDPIGANASGTNRSRPSGWERIKRAVVKKSTADSVRDNYRALCFLVDLEQEEYEYLSTHNEPLQRMRTHPLVVDILNDDEIVDTILGGSLSMKRVYDLGGDNKIRQLLEDPEFKAVVEEIDLVEMCEQVKAYRKSKLRSSAVAWQTSWIDSTLELDACLADATRWDACTNGAATWGHRGIGLIRTKIQPGTWVIAYTSEKRPNLLVNDESLKMERQDNQFICKVTSETADLPVVIMHELDKTHYSGKVEVFKYDTE